VNSNIETFARIRVIGCGGSGGNTINHMVRKKVKGVEFIAINTDSQDLRKSLAGIKINIGKETTKGLGTGMNPELGRKAAEESLEEITEAIKGADMVFIACGMGGGTGTGASPVVAKIARSLGILTVAVVTKPFSFEGKQRALFAKNGIENLARETDAYLTIPNDKILEISDKNTSMKDAFSLCDNILLNAVSGISDLITIPGLINVDFADVKTVMENSGLALMGIGYGRGKNRAEIATQDAISSPLLEISINGAKRLIFSIASAKNDIEMAELQWAAELITSNIGDDAKVITGTSVDKDLRKGEIKITVIATGIPQNNENGMHFSFQKSTPTAKPSDDVIRISSNGDVDKDKVGKDTENNKKGSASGEETWHLPSFLKKKD